MRAQAGRLPLPRRSRTGPAAAGRITGGRSSGSGSSVVKAIDAWERESLRPFGYIGVALGLQDSGQ